MRVRLQAPILLGCLAFTFGASGASGVPSVRASAEYASVPPTMNAEYVRCSVGRLYERAAAKLGEAIDMSRPGFVGLCETTSPLCEGGNNLLELIGGLRTIYTNMGKRILKPGNCPNGPLKTAPHENANPGPGGLLSRPDNVSAEEKPPFGPMKCRHVAMVQAASEHVTAYARLVCEASESTCETAPTTQCSDSKGLCDGARAIIGAWSEVVKNGLSGCVKER